MLWDSVTGPNTVTSASNSWLQQAHTVARRRIIAIVAGSMAAAIATDGLILHQAAAERAAIEEQAATITRGAAAILDGEIAAAKALLDGLYTSPGLRSRNFKTFRQLTTIASQPEDSWLTLLDSQGNPLLYSAATASDLAPPLIGEVMERAAGSGRASVSGLIRAPPGHRNAITISVPILEDGQLAYLLLLAIESSAIGRAFDELSLPPGWAGIVADGDGNVISGRHRGAEARDRLSVDVARRMQSGSSGVLSRDRESRLVTWAPVREAGWLAVVEVPAASLRVPLYKALLAIGVAGAGFMLGGIGLSAWIYRPRKPLNRPKTVATELEQAERTTDVLYRAYWDHTAEALFVYEVTEDGRFLLEALNPAHEQLSGLKIETARGREPHEFLPPEAAAEVTRKYRRCVETAEPMRYEQELSMPAGVRMWETMLVPIRAPNADRVSRLLGSCRDISEVKRFVAALSESEQRFHHIADSAPVLIWISGPDKARTYVNKPWLDFTGRSLEMELGDVWTEGVHPDDLARCLAVYQSHFDRRESFRREYRLKRADGQYRWVDDAGVPRFGTAGDFLGYIGSAVDITERRATEQALRQLAGRLLKVQDEERRRIARDLHDSTAQNLLGAILGIRRALRLDRDMPDEAKRVLEESHDLIRQTEREVRTTCYLLHPPMLDEAGLPAAVRWYVEGFAKRSRIKVDIDIAAELSERRLPQDVEIALFRVVQEALTNVRRHSGSKKARLSLMRSNDDVSLTIEDDGRRMTEVALAFAAGKPSGIAGLGVGITGMSERLRQLGGSLHVHSRSRGVRVTATAPVDRQN